MTNPDLLADPSIIALIRLPVGIDDMVKLGRTLDEMAKCKGGKGFMRKEGEWLVIRPRSNTCALPDEPGDDCSAEAWLARPHGSPVRVKLSRKLGWRKPENTVVVSKPSMWGNPFWKGYGCRMSAAWSYRVHLETELLLMRLGAPAQNHHMRRIAEHLPELRGKNLACWCPLDMPDEYCHAGVLLDLANK